MVVNKEQRVGVFVDVQNMYYSARALYNSKVNFKEILKEAVNGRKLVRAFAYAVRAGEKDEENFHKALDGIGFEVKLKDLQVFYGGNKKADWDVGIAIDAIELAPKLDVVILISGDGDYIPLVEHLKRALGCKVEVMAFGKSCSGKLREATDEFLDMDQNHKKFTFIKR
ncbi:MAG: NYN domain-containing protein [Nanoarchaeota archaeon]